MSLTPQNRDAYGHLDVEFQRERDIARYALNVRALHYLPPPSPFSPMHLDKKFLLRALLAFTTGMFLACAARVSAHAQEPVAISALP